MWVCDMQEKSGVLGRAPGWGVTYESRLLQPPLLLFLSWGPSQELQAIHKQPLVVGLLRNHSLYLGPSAKDRERETRAVPSMFS